MLIVAVGSEGLFATSFPGTFAQPLMQHFYTHRQVPFLLGAATVEGFVRHSALWNSAARDFDQGILIRVNAPLHLSMLRSVQDFFYPPHKIFTCPDAKPCKPEWFVLPRAEVLREDPMYCVTASDMAIHPVDPPSMTNVCFGVDLSEECMDRLCDEYDRVFKTNPSPGSSPDEPHTRTQRNSENVVFLNRNKATMGLASDSTLMFGLWALSRA
jgi:hypothetical protein